MAETLSSTVKDIANGYYGGHGVRLVLKPDVPPKKATNFWDNLSSDDATRIKKKNIFRLTAYNFNPQTITNNNNYGWGGVINKVTDSKPKYNAQQFVKSNNSHTIDLKCAIYPNSFTWLDQSITEAAQGDALQDLKDLKLLAKNGAYFLLTEYDAKTITSINLGYWFMKSINHTGSDYLYGHNPSKIECDIALEQDMEA